MKKTSLGLTVSLLLLLSCKSSKENEEAGFFPILPILQSQVAKVDTTLNSIRQYVFADSSHVDTIFVHRNQFRALAQDFLSLPDIATEDYQDRYKETTQFDETLNRAIFTYVPVNADKEIIQRQEVLIKPEGSGDQITSIIVNTVNNTKDSAIQRRMLWQVDKSFQVTTTRQLVGQPAVTTTVKVVWDEE
ncbi:hypothetical protein LZZ85_07670 [Terrimonas sp. NA20]|uniref:Uncharacterized protein n=1 Tax=Terrimonas ginsenosidimutans TaxID=2908004 RepID=A0ABS9KPC8_9BACT|nr:hypothetical protein [Terrimonas ginsenosidimutans]MCG2614154.1 hypothetical protein [Terrimonas ginsenosidimutans]